MQTNRRLGGAISVEAIKTLILMTVGRDYKLALAHAAMVPLNDEPMCNFISFTNKNSLSSGIMDLPLPEVLPSK